MQLIIHIIQFKLTLILKKNHKKCKYSTNKL